MATVTSDSSSQAEVMRAVFEARLSARVDRASRVKLQHFIPDHWFSAAASECARMFVAGHFCSGSSIPASSVYAEEGILQISPASTNPKFTDDAAAKNKQAAISGLRRQRPQPFVRRPDFHRSKPNAQRTRARRARCADDRKQRLEPVLPIAEQHRGPRRPKSA